MGAVRAYLAKFRAVVAAAIAYALIVQSFAAPIVHARALETARLDAALSLLCLDDPDAQHSGSGAPAHKHQADCCLGAQRDGADLPALASFAFAAAFAAPAAFARFAEPAAPVARPLAIHPETLSPRGPPASV